MEGNADRENKKVAQNINPEEPQPEIKTPKVQESKENIGPKIKYEFFFSPHHSARDIEGLRERFQEADIYMPEALGWTNDQLQILKEVSRGTLDVSRKIEGEEQRPSDFRFNLNLMRIVYNSHKPIVFADLPKGHPLIERQNSLKNEFPSEKDDFPETLDKIKIWYTKAGEIEKEREEYIKSQLKPKVDEVLETNRTLRQKQEVNVLVSLGAAHTPLFYELKRDGEETSRTFSRGNIVYSFGSEAVRIAHLGKGISSELASKVYLETFFNGAFKALLDSLTEDTLKVISLDRKIISAFNFDDAIEVFDRIKQGEGPKGIFEEKLLKKGIKLPGTAEELDQFLGNPASDLKNFIEAKSEEKGNLLSQSDQEKYTIIAINVDKYSHGVKDLPPESLQLIIKNISKNFDVLRAALASDNRFFDAVTLLNQIGQFQLIPEELRQLAKTTVGDYVKEYAAKVEGVPDILHNQNYDIQKTAFVISHLLYGEQSEVTRQLAWSVLNQEFSKWGVKSSDLIREWSVPGSSDSVVATKKFGGIMENLPTAIKIESQRPGIIKVLLQEFGIKSFGRYPQELLIKQFDERDDQTKPYGVILYPRNDWNGAFLSDRYVLKDLFNQLQEERFSIRVTEAESKYDIARALINFRRRYATHKISFAVIGGHGSEYSIKFGGNDLAHSLSVKDLMGKGIKRTSEFFEPDPSLILISCSTGVERGIGQQLSQMMGARIIAPEIPTNISVINCTVDSKGKISFKVEYWGEKAAKSYRAGLADVD